MSILLDFEPGGQCNHPERTLSDKHTALLADAGITKDEALGEGAYTETDRAKLARLLNWKSVSAERGGGLVLPSRDADGDVVGVQVKFDHPRPDPNKPGKLVKYEQRKDTPPAPHIPSETRAVLNDVTVPIGITEGWKKAVCGDRHGFRFISIPGVNSWSKDGKLIPGLAAIKWKGRTVYIVYDSDAATNPNVRLAEQSLAKALTKRGAVVTVVRLPPGEGGEKVGLDDFIVAHGPDAFRRLLAAEPAGGITGNNRIGAVPVGEGGERLIPLIPPPLGADAYHGLIGQFLHSLSPLTEATDAAVLAHLLPAVSCVIGPNAFVYGGTRQPARVNVVVVGPTSEGRKGTAWAIVREFLRYADPGFLDSQVVNGLSTGEGLIAAVADKVKRNEDGEEEVEPTDKRLLVTEEELSRLLAQLRRDGNILSQVVREAFDSGDLGVLTRGAPLRANGTHICLIGHITPDELRERLTGTDQVNGFGNRFLWIYSRSGKILPRTAPVPDEVFAPLAKRLRNVANSPARCVPLSPDADALWCEELYPRLREDKPGLAGAMTARGTAFVLRLALIYCLMDEKKHRGAITVEHLKAAVAVWEYSVASAYLLFKSETGTALGDKLLSLLASGPMKRNQFTDHLARSSVEIEAELNKLLAAGRVTKSKAKPSGAGRPAEVWELATPGGN